MNKRRFGYFVAVALLPSTVTVAQDPVRLANTTGDSAVLQGYGATTSGGSAGSVYHVTTLADSGPGSLRDLVINRPGPRVIVFDVAGTLTLQSDLVIRQPYLTIDGSSAPSPGVTIQMANLTTGAVVIGGTHDIVVRYLRFSGVFAGEYNPPETKLLWVNANDAPDYAAHHIVFDHLTLRHSTGGAPEFYGRITDVTMSWCLIYNCLHPTRVSFTPGSTQYRERFSMHHNAWVRVGDRCPQIGNGLLGLDFVNNVIYYHAFYGSGAGTQIVNLPGEVSSNANLINNFWISPMSPELALIYGDSGGAESQDGAPAGVGQQNTVVSGTLLGSLFTTGNLLPTMNIDNYSTVAAPLPIPAAAQVATHSAASLKMRVMPLVGTDYRSAIEQSYVNEAMFLMDRPSPLLADLNYDSAIDLQDARWIHGCMSRAGVPAKGACSPADLDLDGDVDQDDFGIVQRCQMPPGGVADPKCAQAPTGTTVPPPPPPPPPSFSTLYVATTGNDTADGSFGHPFRTIQRAVSSARAGMTVEVADGVYAESVFMMSVTGTADARITLRAATGARPVIDGENNRTYGIRLFHAHYWTLDGFEVRNVDGHGIICQNTDNIIVRRILAHDNKSLGINVRASKDVVIEFCESYANSLGIKVENETETLYNPDGTILFYGDVRSDRALVRYNMAHDNLRAGGGADGIDVNGGDFAIVDHNLAWQNYDDGIDNSSGSGGGNHASGQVLSYNAAWRNGPPMACPAGPNYETCVACPSNGDCGNGCGIKTSTNSGGNHVIHHNLVFSNTRAGFDNDQEANWGPNRFYNNTAYNNRHGLALDMAGVTNANSSATAFNNLLAGNTSEAGKDHRPSGTYALSASDYNFIGDGVWPSIEGTHSKMVRNVPGIPLLVNPDGPINVNYTGTGGIEGKWQFIWNQIQANFAVQALSPCRNTGVTIPGVTDGYAGSAPDIGAVDRP